MALRQQVWVDKRVQGVLVGRVVLYWFCALLYVGVGSACFQYNQNPEWTLAKHAQVLFGQIWPWLPTAIMLLPLAIYDVVRLSNLFAGPVFRLRKQFAALREDIACPPLLFREEDYWSDLAAPINDMQAEILRLRTGVIELQKAAAKTAENALASTETSVTEDAVEAQHIQNDLAGEDRSTANAAGEAVEVETAANGTQTAIDGTSEQIAEAKPALTEVNEVAIAPLPATIEEVASVSSTATPVT